MAIRFATRPKYPQPSKSSERIFASSRWPPQPATPLAPDCILPNLYLTDLFTARSIFLPSSAASGQPRIKYVLSVLDNSITQPKPRPIDVNKYEQKLIILDDTADADLLIRLNDACDWIESRLSQRDGGVLVHCQLGQSRSASIVIAYVMRKEALDYQTAFEKVKRKRSIVKPNYGFQKQLQLWREMSYEVNEQQVIPQDSQRDDLNATKAMPQSKQAYIKWKEEQREKAQRMLGG